MTCEFIILIHFIIIEFLNYYQLDSLATRGFSLPAGSIALQENANQRAEESPDADLSMC